MVSAVDKLSVMSNLSYFLTLARIATLGKTHLFHLEQLWLYDVRLSLSSFAIPEGYGQ